jgi:hypothetical protein
MTLAKGDVVVVPFPYFQHKLLRRKKPDFLKKVGFLLLLLKSIYPYLITTADEIIDRAFFQSFSNRSILHYFLCVV